jgi:hypothetical protein
MNERMQEEFTTIKFEVNREWGLDIFVVQHQQ